MISKSDYMNRRKAGTKHADDRLAHYVFDMKSAPGLKRPSRPYHLSRNGAFGGDTRSSPRHHPEGIGTICPYSLRWRRTGHAARTRHVQKVLVTPRSSSPLTLRNLNAKAVGHARRPEQNCGETMKERSTG
jgi:hypothetical protein